jgi:hypothetical protein
MGRPRKKKEAAAPVQLDLCDRCRGPLVDSLDQEDGRHYELVHCVEYLLVRLERAETKIGELLKEG